MILVDHHHHRQQQQPVAYQKEHYKEIVQGRIVQPYRHRGREYEGNGFPAYQNGIFQHPGRGMVEKCRAGRTDKGGP